ncbi:MAG: hypothetical protein ACLR9W_03390 [Enterobacter hormaechei]
MLESLSEVYMKIVLINLFNAAKYKAGKYQMVPTLANTFCKFVKHFSFTMAGITVVPTLAYAEIKKREVIHTDKKFCCYKRDDKAWLNDFSR